MRRVRNGVVVLLLNVAALSPACSSGGGGGGTGGVAASGGRGGSGGAGGVIQDAATDSAAADVQDVAAADGAGDSDGLTDRAAGTDATADAGQDAAAETNLDVADSSPADAFGDGPIDAVDAINAVDAVDSVEAAGDAADVVAMAAQCVVPADIYSPIDTLSKTGCVDPAAPANPASGAITYEVNSPLWSDGADKTRAFLLPPGGKIHVKNCAATPADCPNGAADDGKWVFPVGAVMVKTFAFDSKLVETRLLMHADDGSWIGYSYQWNEAQTDATVAPIDRSTVAFNTGQRTVTWNYPSRKDCLECHNGAGGGTLGPETAQLNRVVANTNQIDRLAALNVFETSPAQPYKSALVTPYAGSL